MPDEGLEICKAAVESATKESVNKIAEAIGCVFPFFDTKHQAVTTYIKDIQNSNLSPEVKMMTIANTKKTYKQLKNQCSVARIAENVAKKGTDFSLESDVNDEWLERFMDSSKFVSNKQMQTIWGSILAKEFEKPNSTPPGVIRILTEITPTYAKAFSNICRMGAYFFPEGTNGKIQSNEYTIILPVNEKIKNFMSLHNINFEMLSELETLGLIKLNVLVDYISDFDTPNAPIVHLFCNGVVKTITKDSNKAVPIGNVLLTEAGKSIQCILDNQPVSGYLERLVEYLESEDIEFSDIPKVEIQKNGNIFNVKKI